MARQTERSSAEHLFRRSDEEIENLRRPPEPPTFTNLSEAHGELHVEKCNIFAMWNYPNGPPMHHGKGKKCQKKDKESKVHSEES